jgi:hypothetical protein
LHREHKEVIGMTLFKVTAKEAPTGDYQTASTCRGPLRHTVYKKTDDTSDYKCPYKGCGHAVS